MKNEINILGTKYTVKTTNTIENGNIGKTDFVTKTIYIVPMDAFEFDIIFKHEVLHAFFYESGLMDYSKDEKLVDFLSMQWDKLNYIFKKYLTN